VKLFYPGPAINAEMLEVMLDKHGIESELNPVSAETGDAGGLNQPTEVPVSGADYEKARQLFYAEREDEL
jgi:hypothetical protein